MRERNLRRPDREMLTELKTQQSLVVLGWSRCEASCIFKEAQLRPRGLYTRWCFLFYDLHLRQDRMRNGTRRNNAKLKGLAELHTSKYFFNTRITLAYITFHLLKTNCFCHLGDSSFSLKRAFWIFS